jgi:transcriptional regulator with XRE-family HTH domain
VIKSNLSERLRFLRKERGLKQSELAELLGMSQAAIAKIENNDNNTPVSRLLLLADFFCVSTDFLLGRSDDRRGGKNE